VNEHKGETIKIFNNGYFEHDLYRDFTFRSSITIEEGLQRFSDWYVNYYGVK